MTTQDLAAIIHDAKKSLGKLGFKNSFTEAQAEGDFRTPHATPGMSLAPIIEHTRLAADDDPMPAQSDIATLCTEAKTHHFFGVCVNRPHIDYCQSLLKGTPCKIVTVIGFPNGNIPTETKVKHVHESTNADELDMVIATDALKSEKYQRVFDDIRAVVQAAADRPIKVILETGLLTEREVVIGCILSEQAGAKFVKTSTGKGPRGASVRDIQIMRQCVAPRLGIKAAGGIATYPFALSLIMAGATRIGSSKSLALKAK